MTKGMKKNGKSAQGAKRSQKTEKINGGSKVRQAVPHLQSQGGNVKDILVESREFMASLSATSAPFVLLGGSGSFPGYDINPGNPMVFPWLSKVSACYEKYRFEDLVFELVPRNPTTLAGAVYMAVDYDWDDTPAASVQEFMSNSGAISTDVWAPSSLKVSCARMNEGMPWRYVADVPRTENSQRMVYGGFFMIALAGAAAAVSFDLFVRYRVRLSLPALHAIDATMTYTYPAAQTIAAGTSAAFTNLPSVPGLPVAVTGTAGVPNLVPGAGTPPAIPAGTPVYRLGAKSSGTICIEAQPATAGAPPHTYGADTVVDGGLWDANGTFLSTVSTLAGLAVGCFSVGANTPATWTTNGAVGRAAYTLTMSAIRRLLPTAVYLLPHIYSAAGRVLSTSTNLKTRYIEL